MRGIAPAADLLRGAVGLAYAPCQPDQRGHPSNARFIHELRTSDPADPRTSHLRTLGPRIVAPEPFVPFAIFVSLERSPVLN